jgi:hypothetical protein
LEQGRTATAVERICCYAYYKKGDKTDYNNYRGISLLPTTYKLLSSVLSNLTPYVDEIIGCHPSIFQHNRSSTNDIFIFCIHLILNKNMGVQWDSISVIYRLQENQLIRRKLLYIFSLNLMYPQN